jgi:II/X family phage/plasmid replication protein
MIDTCKFYYKITTRVRKQLRAALNGKFPGIKIYGNCFYPTPRFKTGKFKVYFDLEKMEIQLEASLAKVTQGHNVFGSNDLDQMCLAVIWIIYDYLDLEFTDAEKQLIQEVGIRLGRLDITCSFILASPETVSQVLEYLYAHFRAEGKAWSAYGRASIECLYNQQNSTRVTDKFYNKGIELELNGRGIPATVPEQKRILKMASSILRFEHTMRGKELAELGINYAHDWDTKRVKAVFGARFKQFNLQGVIPGPPHSAGIN